MARKSKKHKKGPKASPKIQNNRRNTSQKKQPVVRKARRQKRPKARQENLSPAHIFIKVDDELSFILENIASKKSRKIFLSAEDGAHILTSMVSMHLLLGSLDRMGKSAVIITQDPQAAKIAMDSGFITFPNSDQVSEEVWKELIEISKKRLQKDLIKPQKPDKTVIEDSLKRVREEVQRKKQEELAQQKKMDAEFKGSQVNVDGFTMVVGGDILDKERERLKGSPMQENQRHSAESSSDMNKEAVNNQNPSAQQKRPEGAPAGRGLLKANFLSKGLSPSGASPQEKPTPSKAQDRQRSEPSHVSVGARRERPQGASKPGIPFGGFQIDPEKIKEFIKKPQFIIPVVSVFVLILVLMYLFLPRMIINLEVESIPVETSFGIVADKAVSEVSIDNLEVPAIQETEKESGSKTGQATGKGERGEAAVGSVSLVNTSTDTIDLASGTSVTSSSGQTYTTTSAVTVPGIGGPNTSVGIKATDVGEDFNYSGAAGSLVFSVAGQTSLTGTNTGAISGGSKEAFTKVLSTDISKLSDALKKELFEAGESDIKTSHENDKWVLIESSIVTEVDGELQADAKAGDEKDTINVSLETQTTALFYDEDALKSVVEDQLKKSLSESDEDGSFEISDDVDIVISVKSVKDGVANIDVKAKGLLTPQIDSSEVVNKVKGLNYPKGLEALGKIEYVSEDPDVIFLPKWFPKFLYRFPSNPNRIEVNIRYVSGEEEPATEEAPTE